MSGGQYATGLSRQGIARALVAAGKDLDRLVPADLGTLEDFSRVGRIASAPSRGSRWRPRPCRGLSRHHGPGRIR
jgi:hypothetical protein